MTVDYAIYSSAYVTSYSVGHDYETDVDVEITEDVECLTSVCSGTFDFHEIV